MKKPSSVFDQHEANALGYKTLNDLANLPPLSDEALEKHGERPIWEEMLAAGLISQKHHDRLTRGCGNTLRHLIEKEREGQRVEKPWTLWADIRRTEFIGLRQLLDIGNFIRATYNYAPAYFEIENERSSFVVPDNPIDVSDLDTKLTEQLAQLLDFGDLGISNQAQDVLTKHDIYSVGDFVVLSTAALLEKGLSAGAIKRIETGVESQTGFAKSDLVNNKVVTQAVRWKYAVMKASRPTHEAE